MSGSAEDRPEAAAGLLHEATFLVALVIAFVVALGFGLVVPVLPLYARQFGVGLFAVTGVVSVFAGVRLVSNLYTGALADRIGTRRAVGFGALGVAGSSLLIAVAPSYWLLLAFRGVGGFGSALFFNALLSMIVLIAGPERRGRAVGSLQGAFLGGIAFGPSVGGLLAEPLGLRWPFVIYAGFCAAAGVVALVWLPRMEDLPTSTITEARGSSRQGLRRTISTARELCIDRAFLAALVMMAASRWAATGVRFSLVPLFGVEVVGASASVIGFSLTLAALTHLAVLWPTGRLADTIGRRAVGAPAYFAFAVIAMGLAYATAVPLFVAALGLYGVGTGLTSVTPPAIVGDVTPPERTGVGIGVLNTAGDLGAVFGPLVSGGLAQAFGYGWGFGASASLLAVGGVFALRMRETLPARSVPAAEAS